ncbi:FAD-dependent monooxygenase [Legionella quateirensis]|uniref:FAD dependent oxidoreductase n=1 Tax=Legionella quateirensis TaxID=45072 RepID=A0A378KR58_9GAMM|nr:FAD-dependent monooxygenase [Legionella quateirensis]KTD42503.1 FAD dependent oxidoreductase [Legionella quateirensis]STY17042.1 FAD dependent oxidoreductase [Legionella quateirensis]
MIQDNIDVLIIGAGPVGLFCANELTRHGLTCRIIDKKSSLSVRSKALGLHIRTLDVLEDCGLLDEVMKQGLPIEGVVFKSNGTILVSTSFAGIEANRHYLIDLPQNQTETIFYQSLEQKGVNVEWDTELTHVIQSPTEITATINKPDNKIELLNATWLIACDGAHSTVRKQVNAEFKGSEYKQAWWLADLLIDWDILDTHMTVYISDRGPLACFPMGNKRYRLVLTAPQKGTTEPTLHDVTREFNLRASDPAILSNPVWISQFNIHHRQIQEYRYDRIFFAGDAAHIHSPMGGQGLNTGIQDIYNLIWKLALVDKGKAKPDLLNSYHEERFPVGQEVINTTDKMTKLMLITNPVLVALRNLFIRLISSITPIMNYMAKNIAELAISYAKSPIVHQSGSAKHLAAGDYLPAFQLIHNETQQATSSTVITQGVMHHVFLFEGLKNKKLTELRHMAKTLVQKYPNSLKVHWVSSTKSVQPDDSITLWIDEQQRVHQHFGLKKPSLILVRPDKYIGLIQQPIHINRFMEDLYLLT